MAAPAEPPPHCVSYGAFSSSFNTNLLLPCKMEASFSLPPSPSPNSSPCLPHSFYTHIPSLIDTPSSCSSPSLLLSMPPSPSTTKKRPACFLSELQESAPFDAPPMSPKRICDEFAAPDGSCAYRSRETISAFVDNALPRNALNNDLLDGAIWRNGCPENGCTENAASGDLDDVLDLLLQEAEIAPTLSMQSASSLSTQSPFLGCHIESSLLAYKLNNNEQSKEVVSKLDYCNKEESKELYTKASNSHENNQLASSAPRSTRTWSETWEGLMRGQRGTGGGSAVAAAAPMQEELKTEGRANNGMSLCEELMEQIAPTCGIYPKQEKIDKEEEEEEEEEQNQSRKTLKEQMIRRPCSSSRWAGPTLLDIESALALTSPPSKSPSSFSFLSSSIRDILKQDPPSPFLSSFNACKEEPILEEDDNLSTWRRLQKRNHMEPRYTVKIRCEEDAVNDGYRWRKYGQKSIKNSPYPRSYYRCSSGKCNVKKQVERSGEDAGLLMVSYEGIHLHHRPSSLLSPTSHTCLPPPPTCEPSFANLHPQLQ